MKEIEANVSENGSRKNIITPPKVGSHNYMAPELFQGETHSIYSDFWSLGCILYELASGSPPFVGHNYESLVEAILKQEVKPIQNFSPEFNDLVKRLLRKLATERITWDVSINLIYTITIQVLHYLTYNRNYGSIHSGKVKYISLMKKRGNL
jgi:serine/threonine protein kinase